MCVCVEREERGREREGGREEGALFVKCLLTVFCIPGGFVLFSSERERERERASVCVYVCVHVFE